MNLRIIQWNVSFKSKSDEIARFLLDAVGDHTVITLQEVLGPVHNKIMSLLKPDSSAYSLNHRVPGRFEGKNRKLGVATYVFGGLITDSSLVSRSVFPERTLHTLIKFQDTDVSLLNFHSITGCDYKKAKSSNFATLADFIYEENLDFFACDANEPKVDSLNVDEIEFFDNKDKGKNAALILGPFAMHNLKDTLKTHLINNNIEAKGSPLATSHIVSKKYQRRYDHIYHSSNWRVDSITHPYKDSIKATSDHSAVIGDFYLDNN